MPPNRVVVIGEADEVEGYALAGAHVIGAGDAESVRAAWASLPPDTGLVLLSSRAARWVEGTLGSDALPLVAVIGS